MASILGHVLLFFFGWFLAGLTGECLQGVILGLGFFFLIVDIEPCFLDIESRVYKNENTLREYQLECVS